MHLFFWHILITCHVDPEHHAMRGYSREEERKMMNILHREKTRPSCLNVIVQWTRTNSPCFRCFRTTFSCLHISCTGRCIFVRVCTHGNLLGYSLICALVARCVIVSSTMHTGSVWPEELSINFPPGHSQGIRCAFPWQGCLAATLIFSDLQGLLNISMQLSLMV